MMKKALVLSFAAWVVVVAACSSPGDDAATTGSGSPAATTAAKTVTPEMLERGRAIYKANCVSCHGESGKGDGPGAGVLNPPPRDHTDREYMSTLTDEQIAEIIVKGGAIKGRPLMPSHPHLRGNDLDSVVAYVRSLSEPKK